MKRILVRIINAYWLKEYVLLFRYYKFSLKRTNKKSMLISVIDNKRNTQGLADRLKGIVSVYALSKATNSDFKCIFSYPFNLQEFLMPDKYNWIADKDELSNQTADIRFKIMRKEPTLKKLMSVFPLKRQIYIYSNVNYLDEINNRFEVNFEWGILFNELFRPTPILQQQIDFHQKMFGGEKYVGCVFRFQSLLGDFEEYNYKQLSSKEQLALIKQNVNALKQLIQQENCRVLVTSDSSRFIAEIQGIENVYTLPGKVVHMDCNPSEKTEIYLKSFLDFYMLSQAQKVYSIGTRKMYPTEFPMYAAKVNNIPFERIIIE